MNIQFGSGVLFATPNAGNLADNPTPMQLPILQEVSVEFKSDLKKLYGQNQFPVAKARGKVDVTGKGKIAAYDPTIFSQLYFGQNTAAGVERPIFNEPAVAAATVAPSQITADTDLGVIAANSVSGIKAGQQLIRVTGTPATGQYKFTPYSATGPTDAAYVFAAADVTAGLQVKLSYAYPDASNGVKLTIENQLMGYAPEVQMLLYNLFRGKLMSLQLNSCVFGTMSFPTKQEDFWVADFDFDASADDSGVLGILQADL